MGCSPVARRRPGVAGGVAVPLERRGKRSHALANAIEPAYCLIGIPAGPGARTGGNLHGTQIRNRRVQRSCGLEPAVSDMAERILSSHAGLSCLFLTAYTRCTTYMPQLHT